MNLLALVVPCALGVGELELVVRRSDGGPAAGAQVRFFAESKLDARDLELVDELAEAIGTLVVADDAGRASLAAAGPTQFVARLPGWWGGATWSGEPNAFELRLHPDRELAVRVVDADGLSLGAVPLTLRAATHGAVARAMTLVEPLEFPGRFDAASGLHRFPRAEFVLRELLGGGAARVQLESFPREAGAWASVVPPIAEAPIVLRATGSSTLSVRAIDGAGALAEDALELLLVHDPLAPLDAAALARTHVRARDTGAQSDASSRDTLRLPLQQGQARVERVHAGAGVLVYVRRNALSDWSGVALDPREEGGALNLALELGRGCEQVRVTPTLRGEPLGGVGLRVRRAAPPSGLPWWPVRPEEALSLASVRDSDPLAALPPVGVWTEWNQLAAGEVRVDVAPQARKSAGLLALAARTPDGVQRFALIDLRARDEAPEHRIAVELDGAGVLVTGVVVDSAGRPLEQAVVKLDMPDPLGAPERMIADPRIGVGVALTDAQGRFSVPAPAGAVLRLMASADGWDEGLLESVKGDAPVRVVLRGRGRVRGVLRASEPGVLDGLNVLLLSASGAGFSTSCTADGRFEFGPVRAGRHELLVRRPRSGEAPLELLRRADLEVVGGEVLELGELRVD